MRNILRRNRAPKIALAVALTLAVLVPAGAAYAAGYVLRLEGSTTVGPIMVNAKPAFNAQHPSGPEIGEIAQTGSSAGRTALINDLCDIAMSSSYIGDTYEAYLDGHQIARDAVCVIVSDEVPADIAQLTKAQLCDIYEGDVDNWNEIGSATSMVIVHRARIRDSGTRETFIKTTGMNQAQEEAHIPDAERLASNSAMRDAISTSSDGAIGYVGLGYIGAPNTRLIPVVNPGDSQPYFPTQMNVYSGKYPLYRYLYLVRWDDNPATTPNDPTPHATDEMAVITWMQDINGDGQDYVVSSGFLRMTPDQDVVIDASSAVDIFDLVQVGGDYDPTNTGNPAHWVRSDTTRDGVVDIFDLVDIGNWYGTTITQS